MNIINNILLCVHNTINITTHKFTGNTSRHERPAGRELPSQIPFDTHNGPMVKVEGVIGHLLET